jgi:TPR repeat protein
MSIVRLLAVLAGATALIVALALTPSVAGAGGGATPGDGASPGGIAVSDPYRDLERARSLVARGEHSLARTYLDTLVIHPGLTGAQRSNAYYYRGFAFHAAGFARSAAQDYMRALDYHTSNIQALMALASLYANGDGVPHDPAEAYRLALMAARNDHPYGALFVGHALLTGTGTPRDISRARYWLTQAAANDLPAALTQLGHSWRPGFTDTPDPERAAGYYRDAIAHGVDDALVALAFMHLNGELEDASRTEALTLLGHAAEREYAPALYILAGLYRDGTASGGEPDYVRAAELCSRAAARGHTPAFALCAYLYGSDTLDERKRAHEYLVAGAERGDSFSQVALADMLLGVGTHDAVAEARRWYRAAAANGNAVAQNNLAWILATSRHDDLRNGREAVAAASAALAQSARPDYLDTMAAAYAEVGDFEQARAVQQRALRELDDDDQALRAEFAERLARYERHEPWRE